MSEERTSALTDDEWKAETDATEREDLKKDSVDPLSYGSTKYFLQGCSKRWAPGCEKMGEKVAFAYLLQEAGKCNCFTSFLHNLGPTF